MKKARKAAWAAATPPWEYQLHNARSWSKAKRSQILTAKACSKVWRRLSHKSKQCLMAKKDQTTLTLPLESENTLFTRAKSSKMRKQKKFTPVTLSCLRRALSRHNGKGTIQSYYNGVFYRSPCKRKKMLKTFKMKSGKLWAIWFQVERHLNAVNAGVLFKKSRVRKARGPLKKSQF